MVYALERRLSVDHYSGDLPVEHIFLRANEHEVAILNARADHAVAVHAQREIAFFLSGNRRVDLRLLRTLNRLSCRNFAQHRNSPLAYGHDFRLFQRVLPQPRRAPGARLAIKRFQRTVQRLCQSAQRLPRRIARLAVEQLVNRSLRYARALRQRFRRQPVFRLQPQQTLAQIHTVPPFDHILP